MYYECPIEDSVPLPEYSETPFKTLRQRAAAACKTAHTLMIDTTKYAPDKAAVGELFLNEAAGDTQSSAHGQQRQILASASNVEYLRNLLDAYDIEIVKEASQIRQYVTARLIEESNHRDPRIRLKSLEMLGKISGVDLFTEKSEITINNKSTIELETTLREKLQKILVHDVSDIEHKDA